MRIISGKYKGKKIFQPTDEATRPLKDLTKESIFNIIQHSNLIRNKIENSNILDLFSGVGSFGLECISRGASNIVFYENYQNVLKILKKSKIKTLVSGISHGTVIAFINKKKFEITTLRKDIKTDGRHAVVEFTKDWIIDSKRRDFTINAISCDFKGNLYDYHNGIGDLKKGKINLIKIEISFLQRYHKSKPNFYEIINFLKKYNYFIISISKVKFKNNKI